MSKLVSKLKKSVDTVKPVKNSFKTIIHSQMASASPPLGPLIGNYGLNIANFCKEFNNKTKNMTKGVPLPVTVRIKPDKSFTLHFHTPPFSYYLKQAAGIQEARVEGDEPDAITGKITVKHAYEIAKIKHEDQLSRLQFLDLNEVLEIVNVRAYQLGIEIVRDYDPVEYEAFLKDRSLLIEELKKKAEELQKAKFLR